MTVEKTNDSVNEQVSQASVAVKENFYHKAMRKITAAPKNVKIISSAVGLLAVTTAIVVPTVLLTLPQTSASLIKFNDGKIYSSDGKYRLIDPIYEGLINKALANSKTKASNVTWPKGVVTKTASKNHDTKMEMNLHASFGHSSIKYNGAVSNMSVSSDWKEYTDQVGFYSTGNNPYTSWDTYNNSKIDAASANSTKSLIEVPTLTAGGADASGNSKFKGFEWQWSEQKNLLALATSLDMIYSQGETTYRDLARQHLASYDQYLSQWISLNSGLSTELAGQNILIAGAASFHGITEDKVGKSERILGANYLPMLYGDPTGSNDVTSSGKTTDFTTKGAAKGLGAKFPSMNVEVYGADNAEKWLSSYQTTKSTLSTFLSQTNGDTKTYFETQEWSKAYEGKVDTLIYIADGTKATGFGDVYKQDSAIRQKVAKDTAINNVLTKDASGKTTGRIIYFDLHDFNSGFFSLFGQYHMLELITDAFNGDAKYTDGGKILSATLQQPANMEAEKMWNLQIPTIKNVRPNTPSKYDDYGSQKATMFTPASGDFNANTRNGQNLYVQNSIVAADFLLLGVMPDYLPALQVK